MSHKIAQVEAILNKAISQVLQRQISDPRIRGLVSITKIKVTSDMKNAFIHVSVLPEKYQRMTVDGLNHARVHIQHLTRKLVSLRGVPHLEFKLDESLKVQAKVIAAINEGMEKTGEESEATLDDKTEDSAADVTEQNQSQDEDAS
ncbi:30S ribosome-binding factor RbfA [Poriferisphaera sp. WC338]|uniref:30S ribosome-binding factor RbfA n=1 Tax=Poriferisphaera sp. WC338 TaxID=3425129 RepID=UPI003D81BCDA